MVIQSPGDDLGEGFDTPLPPRPTAGNAAISQEWTPFDDDNWFQEFTITDLEVVDGVVIWGWEFRGLNDAFAVAGNRTYVDDGKIVRWEWGESVDD